MRACRGAILMKPVVMVMVMVMVMAMVMVMVMVMDAPFGVPP